MDKTLFDEAIGTVPPSTVDVEGIIARQRRAERFRLSAHPWAAAAGLAVVAVGAAAVLAPGGTTDAGGGPPGGCGSLLPTAPPLAEDETAVSARLSRVFAKAVEGMVPLGSTGFGPTSAADYPVGTRHRPFEFYHAFSPIADDDQGGCSGGEDHFAGGAALSGKVVNGNVTAVVSRLGGHATPMAECAAGSVELTGCERSTRSDGTVVVVTTIAGATGVRTFRADVTKPDGTGVIVQAANVTTDGKSAGAPEAAEPPLTHDQLVRVALDPGMTLYP